MIVLGLSGSFWHDSAACIIEDGQLRVLLEEERLTRRKYAPGTFPAQAIVGCLRETGIEPGDIDVVAVSADAALDRSNDRLRIFEDELASLLARLGIRGAKVARFDHHSCHAAACWAFSDGSEAVAVIADGRGEQFSTSVWSVDSGGVEMIDASDITASVGSLYAAATKYCGFGYGGQGKTMGLAAFGRAEDAFPEIYVDGLRVVADLDLGSGMTTTDLHRLVVPRWLSLMTERFGPLGVDPLLESSSTRNSREVDVRLASVAASAQAATERVLGDLVEEVARRFAPRTLLLGGGVALNCALNGKLRQLIGPQLKLCPVPHDVGGAIGAGVLSSMADERTFELVSSPYLGPEWSDAEIDTLLKDLNIASSVVERPGVAAADALDAGLCVAWFQGRSEIGPRALGHRSLLASATRSDSAKRMNSLKGRAWWRPFGPSILNHCLPQVFGLVDAPFMMEAAEVPPDLKPTLSSVCHVDGTTRPQGVDPSNDVSPRYIDLLESIEQRCGLPIVLNTSFNGPHEPIVLSPIDAVRTFYGSAAEMLVIGSNVVRKIADA